LPGAPARRAIGGLSFGREGASIISWFAALLDLRIVKPGVYGPDISVLGPLDYQRHAQVARVAMECHRSPSPSTTGRRRQRQTNRSGAGDQDASVLLSNSFRQRPAKLATFSGRTAAEHDPAVSSGPVAAGSCRSRVSSTRPIHRNMNLREARLSASRQFSQFPAPLGLRNASPKPLYLQIFFSKSS
jgi:hypothetical protein